MQITINTARPETLTNHQLEDILNRIAFSLGKAQPYFLDHDITGELKDRFGVVATYSIAVSTALHDAAERTRIGNIPDVDTDDECSDDEVTA